MTPQRWIVVLLLVAAVVEVVPGGAVHAVGDAGRGVRLGVSAQGVKICVDTLVQTGVDDAFRGRVFSIYDVIFNVVFVAAAAVGAFVIPTSGKSYALLVFVSLGYAATAAGYVLTLRRLTPVPAYSLSPGPDPPGNRSSAPHVRAGSAGSATRRSSASRAPVRSDRSFARAAAPAGSGRPPRPPAPGGSPASP